MSAIDSKFSAKTLLFVQHGWADNSNGVVYLANQLVANLAKEQDFSEIVVFAPDLGWWRTWIKIEPLIQTVQNCVIQAIADHPEANWQIIGHSMGGLIWIELLNRHPEWLPKVSSLVLIGSPIGGSSLSKALDLWGFGIARDLSKNRRAIAEAVATIVPTLILAGNKMLASDGTVFLSEAKFDHAQWVVLEGVGHAQLRYDPATVSAILQFWRSPCGEIT